MLAMNLVDVADRNTCYGILMCENDKITEEEIQDKIYEIKNNVCKDGDWTVDDIIKGFPVEWSVYLQNSNNKIMV